MRPLGTGSRVLLLALMSLAVRLAFSPFTRFGEDEAAIYDRGLDLYLQHRLPPTGARVVYTGTVLPGSLQPLLTGLPLFVSRGLPWGAAAGVALLNFAAMLVTLSVYRRLFPSFDRVALAAFILFAPWTIAYTYTWNPSYVPLYSALLLLGLTRLLEAPRDALGWFLVPFGILSVLQLHLSVVLLVAVAGLALLLGWIRRVHWVALAAGVVAGGATLVPYLLRDTRPEWGATRNPFLLSNIVLNPDNARDFFRILPRFLTFPTGETTWLIGPGPRRSFEALAEARWLWPAFALGMLGSAVIFLAGLAFYLSKRRLGLFARLPSLTPGEKLDALVFALPFLTASFFLFSIKDASEHTYWVLVPFSFLPVLRVVSERRALPLTPGWRWGLLWTYLACITLYTTVGSVVSRPKETLLSIQRVALRNYPSLPRKAVGLERSIWAVYRALGGSILPSEPPPAPPEDEP